MRASKYLKSLRVRILLAISSLTLLTALIYSVFSWFIYDITNDRLFNWYVLEKAKEAVAQQQLPQEDKNTFVVIGEEYDLATFISSRYKLSHQKPVSLEDVLRMENFVPYANNFNIIDAEIIDSNIELQIVETPWGPEKMYLIYDISGFDQEDSPISLFTDKFAMLVLVPITFLIILMALLYNAGLNQSILKPLTNLARQVTGLNPQALTLQKLTGNFYPDEVGELAKTFDLLIARIEEHLQDEKYFSREVSHELRTPTTSLAMALELMESTELDTQQKSLLARMQRANSEMIQLINTFLWLAKNKAELVTPQSVKLNVLINKAVSKLNHLAANKPVKIINDVPEDLELMVNSDLLDIVVCNLLRNALQYTPKGEVRITWANQRMVISDTGLGIPNQEIENINKAFYSLQPDGVGLGLSIVQRIIKKLDWRLEVASKENQGTKVSLYIAGTN